MLLHQGHSSMQKLFFSRPKAGEYCWLTHTGQLKRETTSDELPGRLQNLPWSEHHLCFAHSPSLWPAPCQLRAGNSCPLQEPLQLVRTNTGATASAVREPSSWANSEKLQSYMKLCSSATACSTIKESFRSGRVGGQGGTSKEGFKLSADAVPDTSQSRFRNRSQFPGFQLGMVFL